MTRRKNPLIPGESPEDRQRRLNRESTNRYLEAHREEINAKRRERYRYNPAPHRESTRKAAEKLRRKDPEKWKNDARLRMVKHLYGLTPEDYDAMLESQNGVCKICGLTNYGKQRLAVDHSHDTGSVRALLCRRCNSGLGHFGDSIELIEKAAQYLREYEPTFRPN